MVASFVDDVLVNRRTELIVDSIDDGYIQHNPNVPDGIDALRDLSERGERPKRLSTIASCSRHAAC